MPGFLQLCLNHEPSASRFQKVWQRNSNEWEDNRLSAESCYSAQIRCSAEKHSSADKPCSADHHPSAQNRFSADNQKGFHWARRSKHHPRSGLVQRLRSPSRRSDLCFKTRGVGGFACIVGTPGMAINLWGVSPLYENESLKEGSLPTMSPIGKILDEGNCGRAIDRGKEACECVGKLTENRRQPHSRQSCEVTDRNWIQGRFEQASEPTITKPFSFIRIGKFRACAAKVNRLILGELDSGSGSRPCAESRGLLAQVSDRFQQSAEAIVPLRHTPLSTGRAELRTTRRSY